jgi:hypothetical protein
LNIIKPRYYTDEFVSVSPRDTFCAFLIVIFLPVWWPFLVTYLVLRAIGWVAAWARDWLWKQKDLLWYGPQLGQKMWRRMFSEPVGLAGVARSRRTF